MALSWARPPRRQNMPGAVVSPAGLDAEMETPLCRTDRQRTIAPNKATITSVRQQVDAVTAKSGALE